MEAAAIAPRHVLCAGSLHALGLTTQKVWILGVGRSGTRSYEAHLLGRVVVVRIHHLFEHYAIEINGLC